MPSFDTSPKQFIDALIKSLKGMHTKINGREIDYSEEFDKNVGVWEGYTLREHILLVLNQYSKYDIYDNTGFPEWCDKDAFRMMLALHDIGKPLAVVVSSKESQSDYNSIFVKDILSRLGVSDPGLYSELIHEDIIGIYVKGRIVLDTAASLISHHARNCGMDASKFYILMKIYYMCDAGSYTADSGGKKSLDFLFKFNSDNRKMAFSDGVAAKIRELDALFLS